jgi:DNA repair photolyase
MNEGEIPRILQAAAENGALAAGYVLLRLPWAVTPIFLDWLSTNYPDRRPLVESRLRKTRGGKLTETAFGQRMRGTGTMAEQIKQLFTVFKKKHGLDRCLPPLAATHFRRPQPVAGQQFLF